MSNKKAKVFHSFLELAQHARYEQSKNKGGKKPNKLPPPEKKVEQGHRSTKT